MLSYLTRHTEEVLLTVLFSAMSLLVFTQVVTRYFLGMSLSWSGELSRYIFIWATYIGIAYGVKQHAHISVTVLSDRLSARGRRLLDLLVKLIFLAFSAFLIWVSVDLALRIFGLDQRSSSMGIRMGWIYLAPATGFLLVALRLLIGMAADVSALRSSAE